MLRCAEAEGTELTGGPGWQRRGGGNARLRAGAGWWGRARSGRGRRCRERAAERSARAEALAGGLGRCAAGLERERAGWAGREKGKREWAAGSVGLDWAWGLGLVLGSFSNSSSLFYF